MVVVVVEVVPYSRRWRGREHAIDVRVDDGGGTGVGMEGNLWQSHHDSIQVCLV